MRTPRRPAWRPRPTRLGRALSRGRRRRRSPGGRTTKELVERESPSPSPSPSTTAAPTTAPTRRTLSRTGGRSSCAARPTRGVVAEHGIERDVILRRMRRLTGGRTSSVRPVERRVERALLHGRRLRRSGSRRRGWRGRRCRNGRATRPDALQKRLRRYAGPVTRLPAARQLLDFASQPRIAGALRQQRLVHAQRVLCVPLLQVQLRHRLREHRLRLRQRRRISRAVVVGKRNRRGYLRCGRGRWCRGRRRGGRRAGGGGGT